MFRGALGPVRSISRGREVCARQELAYSISLPRLGGYYCDDIEGLGHGGVIYNNGIREMYRC
jgi:hypothetical protein